MAILKLVSSHNDNNKGHEDSNSREGKTEINRKPRELTHKQEMFCRYVVEGRALVEAYRAAGYSTRQSNQAQYTNATTMRWHNKEVADRINALRQEKAAVVSHDPAQTREFILKGLMKEASEEASKPSDRLKALELLGKVTTVGLFSEKIEQKTEIKSDGAVISELEQRLRKLLAQSDT